MDDRGGMSTPAEQLNLNAWLERNGRLPEAETGYRELLDRQPTLAVAHFNFACFLRRRGRLDEALESHQKALDHGIEQPEEVLSNMGVIHTELKRNEAARSFLHRALAINPNYVPAIFNLALLHEEFGDLEGAIGLYSRILDINPAWHDALVRIAHARRAVGPDDPVIGKLRRALRRSNVEPLTREGLHFALGKVYDDCGLYDQAFEQYAEGNRLSVPRLSHYDRRAEEDQVDAIVATFTPAWMAQAQPVSDRPLIFVTGMFRSGSTLFEQVLAAHPRIAAGGELDYFNRRLLKPDASLPALLHSMSADDWRRLGAGYLAYLDRTFPAGRIVTNKRPDSFALLGLLKAMFPKARFVNTVRDARDTCLSIWFQQLDGRLGYAADLASIAHHLIQYRRLMDHWRGLIGADVFDADYDAYVAEPRQVTRALLDFLGLEWHEGCLEFQRTANRVRTASVAQVREPLYQKSSGRWRNYAKQLEGPLAALD